MKSKKAPWVASTALSALLIVAICILSGCEGKQENSVVVRTSETVAETNPCAPEVYMKDPAFRKKLDEQVKERNGLLARRCALEEALQAEKAKDPASPKVKELQVALEAANRSIEKNRMATSAVVRARAMPQKKGTAK